MPDPWLRKTFTLAAAPRRALLQVASVGYHEVYVNGQRVGDSVLMPCISDFTKRARYVTYDLTRLLRPGTNALSLWLGTAWSIFPPFRTADKPASPIVLAQADLEFADGAKTQVVTDASWRWHPSPNTTIGVWDFLGDWLWPGAEGVNGNTRETLFFNNCYRIYNLQTAARIADVLGQTAPAAAWRTRAAAARAAVHREFHDPARPSYVNGSQAYLALALLAGVPPAELRSAVAQRLEDEILVTRHGHFWAGITGGSFVIKELLAAERPDLVFDMARQEDYPGWGWMLKNGATTMWEDWEGKLSQCHSSYLHLGAWFVEGLAGI